MDLCLWPVNVSGELRNARNVLMICIVRFCRMNNQYSIDDSLDLCPSVSSLSESRSFIAKALEEYKVTRAANCWTGSDWTGPGTNNADKALFCSTCSCR